MPEDDLRRKWNRTPHTKAIARTFNVPINLAASRIRQLGLVNNSHGTLLQDNQSHTTQAIQDN